MSLIFRKYFIHAYQSIMMEVHTKVPSYDHQNIQNVISGPSGEGDKETKYRHARHWPRGR